MANEFRQYRGPYAFADPLVAVREEGIAAGEVTVRVRSTYWPVTVDWGDESELELVPSDEADAVVHTYASTDTYTITVSCGTGNTSTDTLDVSVTVP